ncbi:MAG: histidine kinase dimerization/phospho-acceptor domain-containing protein, partial [Caldisericota bacterium]|nr:histidine kinase dimerization/phospho-acceptor domain-containing protein [Caldisericota bacterium]
MAKRLSNFHNRLILSYGLLVVLVIFLSVTIADAFFIRLFRTFLAGRYGSPFGINSPIIEPDSYLVTETFTRFHDVMHLSLWIGGAVVMLLALVVAGWFTRRLSRPIVGYAQFADRVGRGDYDVELTDTGGMVEFADLAESLNRMARDLKCKDEIERELFSNLSHELRTPVTVIKGYAEAMDGGVITDPGEIHAATQAIAQETVNLESMINELRQLAQIDNNAVHPEPS